MDIINKLRKYTIILAFISVGLIVWMAILDYNNLKLLYPDEELINTIIASLLAVTIAVGVYWLQQRDKYDSLKSSLISFLKTFKSNLESEKLDSKSMINLERESRNIFFRNLISHIIQSGLMNQHISILIEYQRKMDFYYAFLDVALDGWEEKDEELEKGLIEVQNNSLSEETVELIKYLE